MMTKLILATNNQNKLREIREMLKGLPFEVVSQSEAGFDLDVEETGKTFLANAAIKAEALRDAAGQRGISCYTLADDSGLCVEALGGAPGVYSHRYAGENATDAKRNTKLLAEMEGKENRRASFICAMVLMTPEHHSVSFEGEVCGEIGDVPRGENGFGYDPIFYIDGRSFAEFSAEEKNAVSHRKRALEQVVAELKKRMEERKKNENVDE